MIQLLNGRIETSNDPKGYVVQNVYIRDNKCFLNEQNVDITETIDCTNCYVLPGYVDEHIHGAINVDFSNCSVEEYKAVSIELAKHGVTSFVPTLTTLGKEETVKALDFLSTNAKELKGAQVIGIHMEGPYLNPIFCGAQDLSAMRHATISEIEQCINTSKGYLRLITLAPELVKNNEIFEHLLNKNIRINVGHSNATFDEADYILKKNNTCITHFLNGMRAFHQHEPSIFGASVLNDNYIEIICDGFHLVDSTVKVVKQIFGCDRIILISDSIPAAGLEDGRYHFSCFAEDVIVQDGDASLKDSKTRAGSTLFLDRAVKLFRKFTNCSLTESVKVSSRNSLKYLGFDNERGFIGDGMIADIVIVDNDFNVLFTVVNGKIVYRKNN